MIDDELQIDFVNDRVDHYKDIIIKNGLILDNIDNILSNKLTAVIGRDNPKDIFDIYLIWNYYEFNWKEILDSAHTKASFTDEDLIIRLKTFPQELLKSIKLIDKDYLKNFRKDYFKIINEITEINN